MHSQEELQASISILKKTIDIKLYMHNEWHIVKDVMQYQKIVFMILLISLIFFKLVLKCIKVHFVILTWYFYDIIL